MGSKWTNRLALLLVLSVGTPLLADHPAGSQDLLNTAASAGRFRTLISAVVAANLDDALRSDGPFTVLAPSDEAFAKLPPGTLEGLLKPQSRGDLIDLLKYHVLPGRIAAADLAKEPRVNTLNGSRPTIAANAHGVAIDGSVVVKADIACRNGLIHEIDKVLMPPRPSIFQQAEKSGLKTFAAAVKAAGLEETFRGDGTFTVFAPTDEAFARIPAAQLKALLAPKSREALTALLKYHVLARPLTASDLASAGKVTTLEGRSASFTTEGGPKVNKSRVVRADVACSNGIVHVIDRVLTLPKATSTLPEVLSAQPRFKTLVTALKVAGLVDDVSGEGPFTVLAPTNEAFQKLGDEKLQQLLTDPGQRAMLREVLKYHVLAGNVTARDAVSMGEVKTLQGKPVPVTITDGRLRLGKASALETDLKAENGLIHVIDSVLLPH